MAKSTVLIVDSNRQHAQTLATLIAGCGHTVLLAPGVAEALAKVAAAQPALLVMDVALSDGSGYDVLRALASQANTPPVILLLKADFDQALQVQRAWALRQGAREVLAKPVDGQRLLELIADTTGVAQNVTTLPAQHTNQVRAPLQPPHGAPAAIDEALLHTAEQILARYLGPIAKVVVRKTLADSNDTAEFYRQLAQQLPDSARQQSLLQELQQSA